MKVTIWVRIYNRSRFTENKTVIFRKFQSIIFHGILLGGYRITSEADKFDSHCKWEGNQTRKKTVISCFTPKKCKSRLTKRPYTALNSVQNQNKSQFPLCTYRMGKCTRRVDGTQDRVSLHVAVAVSRGSNIGLAGFGMRDSRNIEGGTRDENILAG